MASNIDPDDDIEIDTQEQPESLRILDDQHSIAKYYPYQLTVDPNQDDRASQILLCSFQRPHMRAFHFAWWSYHVAFMMWCVFV